MLNHVLTNQTPRSISLTHKEAKCINKFLIPTFSTLNKEILKIFIDIIDISICIRLSFTDL